jgi:alpha-galactosidase
MEKRKLTIIGAGSAMFTQGLVIDLLNNTNGYKWHIALVDTDEPVLISMAKLVQKMIDGKKSGVTLSFSADRRDVLPGSDYVAVTIGVGKRRAWEQDVYIPRKYGVMQPVGDTAMPGGISRAMRMVPAMLDIASDVKAICPNAVFINYSNPMAIICRAVSKKIAGINMTGLCHGVPDSVGYIADIAGLPREECTAYWGGVNHCTFVYDFRHNGKDAWQFVLDKLPADHDREMFSWWFAKNYGAYPAPGDRHVSEFFTEYFPGGRYYGRILGKDAFSFEDCIEHGDRIHQKAMDTAESPEPLTEDFFRHCGGEHEQLMDIIYSIENDENKIFSANVLNNGSLPGINSGAVLDIPCAVGAHGFSPIPQPQFPAVFAAHTNRFLACIDIAAEAALTGSRKYFSQAILMGGYLSDKDAADKMTEELIEAQKEYLPQF